MVCVVLTENWTGLFLFYCELKYFHFVRTQQLSCIVLNFMCHQWIPLLKIIFKKRQPQSKGVARDWIYYLQRSSRYLTCYVQLQFHCNVRCLDKLLPRFPILNLVRTFHLFREVKWQSVKDLWYHLYLKLQSSQQLFWAWNLSVFQQKFCKILSAIQIFSWAQGEEFLYYLRTC